VKQPEDQDCSEGLTPCNGGKEGLYKERRKSRRVREEYQRDDHEGILVRRFQAVASNGVTAIPNLVQGPFPGDARLLLLQGKKLVPGCFLRGLLSITAGLSIHFCGGLRPSLNIKKAEP